MSGSFQPNVMFNLAGSFGAGQRDAESAQRNALFMQETQRAQQERQAAQTLAPRILQGDQSALSQLAGVAPEAAMRWQTQLSTLDASRRQQALQAAQWFGQGAQALLAVPEGQRPQEYARLRQEAEGLGFGSAMPAQYPGDAALQTTARRAMTVGQQIAADESRIVPASMPMPGAGGGGGGAPNVPAQREAVDWLRDARRSALERFSGPELDAELNRINEEAGQRMGRRPGGSTTAFQGSGGLTPLMRGGRPFTEGLPAGYQWADGPGGRQAMPIPGAPTALREQPSYDTVQTAEGVFRVNNRDPNDRVRIGDRPQTAKAGDGRLPAALVKMDDTDIGTIQTASGIAADLSSFRSMIQSGQLPLSGLGNVANRARNTVGLSTEQSRNLASFEASLERLRNESLRLNAGVQTDGDAQRAWAELVSNINDPGVVAQRLAEIERINQRAIQLRLGEMNRRRGEYGAEPISLEAAGGVQAPAFGQGTGPAPAAPPQAAAPQQAAPSAPGGGAQGLPPLPPGFQMVP